MIWWFIVGGVAVWLLSRAASSEAAAKRIREKKKQIYQAAPQNKIVSADKYSHLDQGFYRSLLETLQALDFRMLADIDPGTPTVGAHPVAIRVLLSRDRSVVASGYNFRAKFPLSLLVPGMRNLRVVDFESELDDGSFVVTTNAYASRHTTNPPRVLVKYFEPETPVAELLRTHRRRVHARTTEGGRACISAGSLDEVFASQERLRRIKAEFESARDHVVDRDELTLAARDVKVPGVREVAHEVADEMGKPKDS